MDVSPSVCSNLRCNECDFTVVQFPESKFSAYISCLLETHMVRRRKWDASADYMFFRENVPSEVKLRAKMEIAPGKYNRCLAARVHAYLTCVLLGRAEFAAYACQCKWLSISSQTRVDHCQVKWSCAGH